MTGSENPHAIREIARECLVCFVMFGSLGTFFLCGINSDRDDHLDMLQLYLLPQLEDRKPDVMFQQDGAPPHWACILGEFLDKHFPGHWVGRNGPIACSPHPPEIKPFDSFLCEDTLRKLFTRTL
jgi:hypothetical protein